MSGHRAFGGGLQCRRGQVFVDDGASLQFACLISRRQVGRPVILISERGIDGVSADASAVLTFNFIAFCVDF